MESMAAWFAFAIITSGTPARADATPTAQELGYPVGCTALYGGTGGVHLIKVNCPGPDISNVARDVAIKARCNGKPVKLKCGRTGSNPDDYECISHSGH